MKRKKDNTEVKCQICKAKMKASGMPSHLYRKHDKMSSDQYVEKYGEFRKKYLEIQKRKSNSKVKCKICNQTMLSHKHLLHHLHTHNTRWQDYFVKYFFNNKHPTCSCGCGEKVQLIKQGKNEKGETTYARTMLTGHHKHRPGYRTCTYGQKMRMRESAIKRLQEKQGSFFNNGPNKSEQELTEFLKQYTEVITTDRKTLSGKEIDILLPKYNIGIEYNGGYFHSDLFKSKKYHLDKTLEAEYNGVRLIHIWEHDWYNSKDKIKSLLISILGKNSTFIYARKCEVREISNKQANQFLDLHHLQGSCVGKIRIGLYYQQELVSVMVFSSLRKATGLTSKKANYELVRFCTKQDHTVVGGASKLFKFFTKKYLPQYIISYANRDWSMGNLYRNLGFKEEKPTPPGYFYVKSKYKFNRFQFQKHKLVKQGYDENKTEYQIMLERGFYRIWDCGNLKFTWTSNTLE